MRSCLSAELRRLDSLPQVYAYHGGNRSQDVDFLASCDVVSS